MTKTISKKLLILIMTFAVMFTLTDLSVFPETDIGFTASAAAESSEPSQVDGYYQIGSAEYLLWFANLVNNENETYGNVKAKLTADIDLSTVCGEDNNWTPIGNKSRKFSGTFDGDGHKISGLYINTNESYQGLFGYLYTNGEIKNLTVEGTVTGNGVVGGVCGYNNGGTIENCYNTGTVTATGNGYYVGGVCGYNNGGTIENCYNTGTVTATGDSCYVGGVCGYNNEGTIQNCYNTGTIEVNGIYCGVGGVCGYNEGTIQNCYNTGTVTATGDGCNVGGVCGYNYEGTIQNCYNTGTIEANGSYCGVGGVCGFNYEGTIQNCYNTGTVTATGDGCKVGGVCGYKYNGTITNCYNQGSVTATSDGCEVGGVCGFNESDAIENCYYLNSCGASGTGTSKTAEEFNSGEVCYLLNGGDNQANPLIWYQTLGSDDFPVLDSSHGTVYNNYADCNAELPYANNYYPNHPEKGHKWTYTASGDTINAVCDYDNTHKASVKISADNSVYDSEVHENAVIDYSNWKLNNLPQNLVISYTGDTTNVGTVTASITVGGAKAECTYNITQRSITGADVTLDPSSVVYDGELHTPEVTVVLNEKTLTADDYDIDITAINANADTYTVTVTGKGNYKDTASADFTVDKAVPVCTVPKNLTATYGDDLSSVNLPTADNGTWSWESSGKVGNVGENTFQAKFTPTDTTNYSVVENIDVTVNVGKRPVTVKADDMTMTYGGSVPEYTFTVPAGALVGSDTAADLGVNLSVDADKLNAGTYDITGTASNDTNYDVTVENGTLTVNKKVIAVSGITVSDKYYDETVTADITGVAFSNVVSGETISADDYTVSGEFASANVGTNEVKITIALKDTVTNYTLSAGIYTFIVTNPIGKATTTTTTTAKPVETTTTTTTAKPVETTTTTITAKPVETTTTTTTAKPVETTTTTTTAKPVETTATTTTAKPVETTTTTTTTEATTVTTTTVYYKPVVTKVNAEVKADVIANLEEGEELPIELEGCSFVFDSDSVINIKEQLGEDKDIVFNYDVVSKDEITNEAVLEVIKEYDAVLNFSLKDSDGNKIVFSSDEAGKVTVTIPYNAPVEAENVSVYYIADDGTAEKIENAYYDPVAKTIRFDTTHFSYYAVKAEDENGEVVKKPETTVPETTTAVTTVSETTETTVTTVATTTEPVADTTTETTAATTTTAAPVETATITTTTASAPVETTTTTTAAAPVEATTTTTTTAAAPVETTTTTTTTAAASVETTTTATTTIPAGSEATETTASTTPVSSETHETTATVGTTTTPTTADTTTTTSTEATNTTVTTTDAATTPTESTTATTTTTEAATTTTLPQTGNNTPDILIITVSAIMLALTGMFVMKKSKKASAENK